MLLVNDQQPYKTLKDLIDDAKKRPNEIIFSSSGLYGALHIPMALFMKAAGDLKMRHLPTNGGGPALTAFLGNNSQVLVSSIVGRHRRRSRPARRRPLAMFGDKRSKALPDVPTMKELGYDIEYYLWVGMFAPKGTPDADHRPCCAQVLEQGRAQRSVQDRDDQYRPGARLSWTSPSSRNSGTRTPRASKTPCAPSAACRASDKFWHSGRRKRRSGSVSERHNVAGSGTQLRHARYGRDIMHRRSF